MTSAGGTGYDIFAAPHQPRGYRADHEPLHGHNFRCRGLRFRRHPASDVVDCLELPPGVVLSRVGVWEAPTYGAVGPNP